MKRFVLLGTMLCSLTIIGAPKAPSSKPKAIIFDIHGVLFEEDSMAFAKKVGLGAISSYTISHWKNPVNTCLDALEHMSKDARHTPNMKFTFKDRQMPHCIVEWQCGRTNYQEVAKELTAYWNHLHERNYFKSTKEREITESVMRIALDPNGFTQIAKPIEATLKLARELKKQGYTLYLAGNMPKEPYEIMLKEHPEIKKLFAGIHVSCHVGCTKPDSKLFSHIMHAHNLKAEQCLLIDDETVNVNSARQLGMQTVLFTSAKQVERVLKKQGIL